jgi:hypothetical protein
MGEVESGGLPEPWEIPASELHTQRLFRLRYGGPEGEGGLRLTLRIVAPARYRVSTVDLAGRALWSLSVEGEDGLWIDHRGERFCRFSGSLGLAALPLSPFPLPALPALLLGRAPAVPAGRVERTAGRLEYQDSQGRRWRVETAGREVLEWTLWGEAGPAVWWRRQAGEAIVSERERAVQIRWREVLRESLLALPSPPEVPAAYAAASCTDI